MCAAFQIILGLLFLIPDKNSIASAELYNLKQTIEYPNPTLSDKMMRITFVAACTFALANATQLGPHATHLEPHDESTSLS